MNIRIQNHEVVTAIIPKMSTDRPTGGATSSTAPILSSNYTPPRGQQIAWPECIKLSSCQECINTPPATGFCSECRLRLCPECVSHHSRVKSTAHHVILDMNVSEGDAQANTNQRPYYRPLDGNVTAKEDELQHIAPRLTRQLPTLQEKFDELSLRTEALTS